MLPHYENCCHHQEWQFDGTDLAKKQFKEICAHASEISNDSIQSLGNGCFYVRSATNLAKMYLVNLSKVRTSVMSTGHLIDYGKEIATVSIGQESGYASMLLPLPIFA